MTEEQMRPIKIVRIKEDRTWDTVVVEIPLRIHRDYIEEEALDKAREVYGDGRYAVYSTMDDECPLPKRYEAEVKFSFDLDEVTTGLHLDQLDAAIDAVNDVLARQPYGLGARISIL